MIGLEFISPFFDGRVEAGLETTLFGRIVASEDNARGEISSLLVGGREGRPDTGTTLELVTVFAKESGRLDYLLEPLDYASAAGGPLPPIEILWSLLRECHDTCVRTDGIHAGDASPSGLVSMADIFRLRSGLRHFIGLCQILKRHSLIEGAEDILNWADLRIYSFSHGKDAFAEIARRVGELPLVEFADLCSWAALSGALSAQDAAKAMGALSEVVENADSNLDADRLGLVAGGYCAAGDPLSAMDSLGRCFARGAGCGEIGWPLHAAMQFLLGARPEYYGIRIVPAHHQALDGVRLRRSFRGRALEIEIVRPEAGSSSSRRIFLNGERHEGDIVHLLDLKEENKIRAET